MLSPALFSDENKKPEQEGKLPLLGAKFKIFRGATRIQSISLLLRTPYACGITAASVEAYTAICLRSALESPFTKRPCTAITPSAALCGGNDMLLLFLKGLYVDYTFLNSICQVEFLILCAFFRAWHFVSVFQSSPFTQVKHAHLISTCGFL